MMRYYKSGETYIATVGQLDAEEITQEAFEAHLDETIRNLDEPDPDASELLDIIIGGAV